MGWWPVEHLIVFKWSKSHFQKCNNPKPKAMFESYQGSYIIIIHQKKWAPYGCSIPQQGWAFAGIMATGAKQVLPIIASVVGYFADIRFCQPRVTLSHIWHWLSFVAKACSTDLRDTTKSTGLMLATILSCCATSDQINLKILSPVFLRTENTQNSWMLFLALLVCKPSLWHSSIPNCQRSTVFWNCWERTLVKYSIS